MPAEVKQSLDRWALTTASLVHRRPSAPLWEWGGKPLVKSLLGRRTHSGVVERVFPHLLFHYKIFPKFPPYPGNMETTQIFKAILYLKICSRETPHRDSYRTLGVCPNRHGKWEF